MEIDVDEIDPQPLVSLAPIRSKEDREPLKEAIKKKGPYRQPSAADLGKNNGKYSYRLMDRENLFHTLKESGYEKVPCLVYKFDGKDEAEREVAEIAFILVDASGTNPYYEAIALNKLAKRRGIELLNSTDNEVNSLNELIGKGPSWIESRIKLSKTIDRLEKGKFDNKISEALTITSKTLENATVRTMQMIRAYKEKGVKNEVAKKVIQALENKDIDRNSIDTAKDALWEFLKKQSSDFGGEALKSFYDKFSGFVGEELFKQLLDKWHIPHYSDYPEQPSENRLVHDFFIPRLGAIEVKVASKDKDENEVLNIKAYLIDRNNRPEFIVAIKLNEESYELKGRQAEIAGYLKGNEVITTMKLRGVGYSPYYQCCIDKLRKDNEFLKNLIAYSENYQAILDELT